MNFLIKIVILLSVGVPTFVSEKWFSQGNLNDLLTETKPSWNFITGSNQDKTPDPPRQIVISGSTIPEDGSANDLLSMCGDWLQVDNKCYKIIKMVSSKGQAVDQCKNLDLDAKLVQIHSHNDLYNIMEMLNTYKQQISIVNDVLHNSRGQNRMTKTNFKVTHIWLGIRYMSGRDPFYYWEDQDRPLEFTNWEEDSLDTSGTTNLCVQMDLDTGKWSDVRCGKKYLIVCQKPSQLDLDNLYRVFHKVYLNFTKIHDEQGRVIERLESKLKDQDLLIESLETMQSEKIENLENQYNELVQLVEELQEKKDEQDEVIDKLQEDKNELGHGSRETTTEFFN